MSRIAYVNGRYLLRQHAGIDIEDRGFQFADGVYEVCEVRGGRLVEERRHVARLARSLEALQIKPSMTPAALGAVMRETIRRNRMADGVVYVQVTRGIARRDHAFPVVPVLPSVVVTASRLDFIRIDAMAAEGVAVVTVPDNRWDRVDIKSISLLPNVLAKQTARSQGAREAWFVKDGKVTEGASSNAWIVTRSGQIVTHPANSDILSGITRMVVLEAIAEQALPLEERPFTPAEVYDAREAFVTSSSQSVMPVVRIDGRPIGNGAPGLIATALRRDFHRRAEFS